MRRMIATCLVLAVAGSCSQSTSTPGGTSTAGTKKAMSPATESAATGATTDVAPQPDGQVAAGLRSESVPERSSRLAVGEVAPDFHLQDQTGAERSLKGLLSGGKVALVLYRSADW